MPVPAFGVLKLAVLAAVLAVVLVVPTAVLGVILMSSQSVALGAAACGDRGTQQVGDHQWTGEQMSIAQLIVAAAVHRTLPQRAAVLAVATAMVESQLRNLPHGDSDSLGVFQQRPSQGWGTPEQILNPTHAANTFYDHLLAIPGWGSLPPGAAEQAVQRSAFPDRYAPREAAAAALVTTYWVGPDNPVPPTAPTDSTDPLAGVAGACPDRGKSDITIDHAKLPPDFRLPSDPQAAAAVSYALAQLGKSYVWGATGPDNFDCSGLMLAAWAHAGVAVSRTTFTQVHDGTPVSSVSAASPGDLLFIPGSGGTAANPGHVGMYAGAGVVVDAYDDTHGVILESLTSWAPKVVAVRHIAGATAPRT